MITRSVAAAAVLFWIASAMSETTDRNPTAGGVPCRRTATAPPPFGHGDWQRATPIEHFFTAWEPASRAAQPRTRARLLWDDDYLYFSAEMADDELISASTEDGAKLWLGDVFELFFKPSADRPGYYEFQVNPAGARLNMYLPHRTRDGYERWHLARAFDWVVDVRTGDGGWNATGRIPWSDFAPTGGKPQSGDTWKFALCRYDYGSGRPPLLTSTAPLTRADFHRYEEWGDVTFTE